MFKVPKATAVIKQSLKGCFNNLVTFPEHVKAVKAIGVVRYEVDLHNNQVTYHFEDKTVHTESLPRSGNNFIPGFFAKRDVETAVKEIQKKDIDYPTFLDKIISAGTQSYDVNIEEGKVVYKGENDQHVEKFPTLNT